ncbi:hypothetical protein TWF788_008163 [Orbilia oligospora]|uniref:Uncharacterized protein n=1 Tax=Orbilia oligospora TaxID=2813651 RepID=A0A7C8U643_ORBOL|nr:hypothetical protein TWF788_008163 [Orbilia oligospora]
MPQESSSDPPSDEGLMAVKASINKLKDEVFKTLKVENGPTTPSGGQNGGSNKRPPRLQYQMSAQIVAAVETDWKLTEGFVIEEIMLGIAADMSSHRNRELDFYVSAEIPELRSGEDVEVIFELQLLGKSSLSELISSLASIKGIGSQEQASQMIPTDVSNQVSQEQFSINLQLKFVKPVAESFEFSSFRFSVGGDINFRPSLQGIDLNIKKGFLTVEALKSYGESGIHCNVHLKGIFSVGNTEVDVVCDFQKEAGQNIVTDISLSINPIKQKLNGEVALSTTDILSSLRKSSDTQSESKPSILDQLGLNSDLEVISEDLQRPNMSLYLQARLRGLKVETFIIQALAQRNLVYQPNFMGEFRVKNLMVTVDVAAWRCELHGVIELKNIIFDVLFRIDKDQIYLKAVLRYGAAASLSDIGSLGLFNKVDGAKLDIGGYADSNSVGDASPVPLGRIKNREIGGITAEVYFELLVTRQDTNDKSQKDAKTAAKGESSNKDLTNGHGDEPRSTGQGTEAEPTKKGSYQLDSVKFYSHLGTSWEIIPGILKFTDLGICFDVAHASDRNLRQMRGLVYGKWTLKNYILMAFVLGQSDPKATDIWVGLSVHPDSASPTNLNTVANIIADPKFANDLSLPELSKPSDIKDNPNDKPISTGFTFDGDFRARFRKVKDQSGSSGPKDLSGRPDPDASGANIPKDTQNKGKPMTMEEVYFKLVLKSSFQIYGSQALGGAQIEVRVLNPTIKEKRKFGAYLGGFLIVEGYRLSITATIPFPATYKAIEDGGGEASDTTSQGSSPSHTEDENKQIAAAKLALDAGAPEKARKHATKPTLPFKKEPTDIVFQTKISKQTTSSGNQVNPSLLLKSDFSQGASSDQVGVNEVSDKIPDGFPISPQAALSSTDFSLDIRVGQESVSEHGVKRTIKSVAIGIRSTEEWEIIQGGKLKIGNFNLQLLVANPQNKDTRQVMALFQGTLVIGDTRMVESSLQIAYSNGVLGFQVVVLITLSKLMECIDLEAPDLLRVNSSKIVAGFRANVRNKTFESYDVTVATLGAITLLDTIELYGASLQYTYDNSEGKKEKSVIIAGCIGWKKSPKSNEGKAIKATVVLGKSVSTLTFDLEDGTAGQIIDKVTGDLDSIIPKDDRPGLPSQLGMNDWDEKEGGKNNKIASATIVFEEKTGGSRALRSIEIALALQDKQSKWDLIDDHIWITDFKLNTSVNFADGKYKDWRIGTSAVLKYKTRQEKSEIGSSKIEMTVNKESLQFTMDTPCDVPEILWIVTKGFIDVPKAYNIPFFKSIGLTLSWKKEEAKIDGKLLKDGDRWTFGPEMFGKDFVAMLNPRLSASVGRKGKPSASLAGTIVLFGAEIDVEYVLPKGPLKIEGVEIDLKNIKDFMDKVKNKIKNTNSPKSNQPNTQKNPQGPKSQGGQGSGSSGSGGGGAGGAGGASSVVGTFVSACAGVTSAVVGGVITAGGIAATIAGFFASALAPVLLAAGAIVGGIIGGLLIGPVWNFAKGLIIDTVKGLFDTVEDQLEAIFAIKDKLRQYEAPLEPPRSEDPNRDPADPHGRPRDPTHPGELTKPRDPVTGEPINVEQNITVTGRGTCAGPPNELVELFVTAGKIPPEYPVSKQISQHVWLTVEFRTEAGTTTCPMISTSPGLKTRIPYRRPESDYKLHIKYVFEEEGSYGISQNLGPLNISIDKDKMLSPSKSSFNPIPYVVAGGIPFVVELTLRDYSANVRSGYDDRSNIQLEPLRIVKPSGDLEAIADLEILSFLNGVYRVRIPALASDQKYVVSASLRQMGGSTWLRMEDKLSINTVSIWSPRSVVVRGKGALDGPGGEEEKLKIYVYDFNSLLTLDVDLSVVLLRDGQEILVPARRNRHFFVASYTRPASGTYQIVVKVNGVEAPNSPFTLQAVPAGKLSEALALQRQRQISWIPPPTDVDSSGLKRSFISIDDFSIEDFVEGEDSFSEACASGKLVCRSAENNETVEISLQKNLSMGCGVYRVDLLLSVPGKWDITFHPSDTSYETNGRRFLGSINVLATTKAHRVYAFGEGVQNGFENTITNFKVQAFDEKGAQVHVEDSEISVSVLGYGSDTMSPIPFSLAQGVVSYSRPTQTRFPDPEKRSYPDIRTWSDIATETWEDMLVIVRVGEVEAVGSPFVLSTIPHFRNIVPAEIRGMATLDRKSALVHIKDNYGGIYRLPRWISTPSTGGGYESLLSKAKPDFSYQTPNPSGNKFSYILDADALKDVDLMLPIAVKLGKPLVLRLEDTTVKDLISIISATAGETRLKEVEAWAYPLSLGFTELDVKQLPLRADKFTSSDNIDVYTYKLDMSRVNHSGYWRVRFTYQGFPLDVLNPTEEPSIATFFVSSFTFAPPSVLTDANPNDEKEFFTRANKDRAYSRLQLSEALGSNIGGTSFNCAHQLVKHTADSMPWPTLLVVRLSTSKSLGLDNRSFVITHVKTQYSNEEVIEQGSTDLKRKQEHWFEIEEGTYIVKGTFSVKEGVGLGYMQLMLSNGEEIEVDGHLKEPLTSLVVEAPEGFLGARGFWGREGGIIDRLGLVWGK